MTPESKTELGVKIPKGDAMPRRSRETALDRRIEAIVERSLDETVETLRKEAAAHFGAGSGRR